MNTERIDEVLKNALIAGELDSKEYLFVLRLVHPKNENASEERAQKIKKIEKLLKELKEMD